MGDLFEIKTVRGLDEGKLELEEKSKPGYIEFIGRTRNNNGIKGYLKELEIEPNPEKVISVSQIGTIVAQIRNKKWYASQNIFLLKAKKNLEKLISLFSVSVINIFLNRNFSDGYSNYPTLDKLKNLEISLPVKNGKIDFEFMEEFIAELEALHIAELEAYLLATGLKDYNLTIEEERLLRDFESGKIEYGKFRLGDLFEIQNTLSFNKDALVSGNEYDYITRTSQNQGILRETGFINKENINPAGIWSLGLLQMDFFYRKKPWYAGQFVKKIIPKIEIKNNSILFFSVILNQQKNKLLSVLVRDVDKTFKNLEIYLPVKNGKIDFEFMEIFISTVQKLIIKDVVLYSERKIETIKNIVGKYGI